MATATVPTDDIVDSIWLMSAVIVVLASWAWRVSRRCWSRSLMWRVRPNIPRPGPRQPLVRLLRASVFGAGAARPHSCPWRGPYVLLA